MRLGTAAFILFQFSVEPLFGLHPGVLGMIVGALAISPTSMRLLQDQRYLPCTPGCQPLGVSCYNSAI